SPVKGTEGVIVDAPADAEDIFAYLNRVNGNYDQGLYKKLIGAANEFKEEDMARGVSAATDRSRANARTLLANTKIEDIDRHSLHSDEISELIRNSTAKHDGLRGRTIGELKQFILTETEARVKEIMPALSSDVIACVVKLMSNEELVQVGQKIFNPLPGSKIGSKGYMGARVQPNSPTDNVDDISWQVF